LTEIVLDYGSLGMGKSRQIIAAFPMNPNRHKSLLAVLMLCLAGTVNLSTAEPSTAATSPPPALSATKDDRSALMRETRQYVAQVTEERNQLRDANDLLRNRQGLLAFYGVVMTLLAGWLLARQLKGNTGTPGTVGDTDIFSSSTAIQRNPSPTVVMRKNATITIRNGTTQQAEVTERVQTRAAFVKVKTDPAITKPSSTRSVTRPQAREATPSAAAKAAESVPKPSPAPTLPTQRMERMASVPVTASVPKRPSTVGVEHQSDRLDPVEVAVKPGTGSIRRNLGFSSMEMLIAVLMLTAFSLGLMQAKVISHSSESRELGDKNSVLQQR
jgi:hypothetical protein